MSYKYKLYGAILGDLCGQPFEFDKSKNPIIIHNPESHFTDDTLMTLAVAKSIIEGSNVEYEFKDMGNRYQGDYYGKNFKAWLTTPLGTKGDSWGNGCIMRISPYMYIQQSLPQILEATLCSHFNQRSVESVIRLYNYYKGEIEWTETPIKPFERFVVECDATLDFCINVVCQTYSTHEGILTAVKAKGDTDTNASIIGEFNNYIYKDLTQEDVKYVESKLDPYLLSILKNFNDKY